MDMQYQLKADGYYLYDMNEKPSAITGERRFKLKTDTVAIAFDSYTGKVHEHGTPTRIHSWAINTRRRLRAAGALDIANDIVVISGPLPVEEINKCLKTEGYVQTLFKRLGSLPNARLGHQAPADPLLRKKNGVRQNHELFSQNHLKRIGQTPQHHSGSVKSCRLASGSGASRW